jgi:hypothetical protein
MADNPEPADNTDDPRHINQARAWHTVLAAEAAVFTEPTVMRTGLTDALRKAAEDRQ